LKTAPKRGLKPWGRHFAGRQIPEGIPAR